MSWYDVSCICFMLYFYVILYIFYVMFEVIFVVCWFFYLICCPLIWYVHAVFIGFLLTYDDWLIYWVVNDCRWRCLCYVCEYSVFILNSLCLCCLSPCCLFLLIRFVCYSCFNSVYICEYCVFILNSLHWWCFSPCCLFLY